MRRGAKSWWEGSLLLVLLPVLLGAGGPPERAVTPDPAAERALVERINESRARNGLPKLELNPLLALAARAHALEMARQRQVTHRFPQEAELRLRVADTGLRFDFAGENVGVASDAEQADQAFLSSPGHRENILQPAANAVGVGAIRTEEGLWVTEDFAHVVPGYNSQQVEELVAQGIAEARREAGLQPLLSRVLKPLREEACDMAGRDSLEFSRGLLPSRKGTLVRIAYAIADPVLLPPSIQELVARKRPDSFSLGACPGRTATYPSGAYWIVVVFYFSQ